PLISATLGIEVYQSVPGARASVYEGMTTGRPARYSLPCGSRAAGPGAGGAGGPAPALLPGCRAERLHVQECQHKQPGCGAERLQNTPECRAERLHVQECQHKQPGCGAERLRNEPGCRAERLRNEPGCR